MRFLTCPQTRLPLRRRAASSRRPVWSCSALPFDKDCFDMHSSCKLLKTKNSLQLASKYVLDLALVHSTDAFEWPSSQRYQAEFVVKGIQHDGGGSRHEQITLLSCL